MLLPATAYSETLVAFARARRLEEARQAITSMGITVVPLTDAIAERAAGLRARHTSLRLPDAIVLATAQGSGRKPVELRPQAFKSGGQAGVVRSWLDGVPNEGRPVASRLLP